MTVAIKKIGVDPPPQDGRAFIAWCTWAETWCRGVYSAPVDCYLRLDAPVALFLPTKWIRYT